MSDEAFSESVQKLKIRTKSGHMYMLCFEHMKTSSYGAECVHMRATKD